MHRHRLNAFIRNIFKTLNEYKTRLKAVGAQSSEYWKFIVRGMSKRYVLMNGSI